MVISMQVWHSPQSIEIDLIGNVGLRRGSDDRLPRHCYNRDIEIDLIGNVGLRQMVDDI